MAVRKQHVVIVNEVEVDVNKYQLALHSDYFERFFFGEEYKANKAIVLEPPATVEHFGRMQDALHPQNKPLDDGCIEGVYQLANRFQLTEVEEKCRNFLLKESKRSAIFKYRLAEKFGDEALKKQIFDLPKETFTKAGDFVENLEEFAKLDEKAREALKTHLMVVVAQLGPATATRAYYVDLKPRHC